MTIIEQIKAEIERLKTVQLKRIQEGDLVDAEPYDKNEAYNELLSFLDTLESEKPINPEDAMKELDEKIAIVKRRGTWDGVDVDKYMDEVRGREPEKPINQDGLEEEFNHYCFDFKDPDTGEDIPKTQISFSVEDALNVARHFVQWQKEQDEISKVNYEGARAVYDNTVKHLQEKIDEKYELGKKDMKEQMLKEAVEGEYGYFSNASKTILPSEKLNIKEGEKVRIIIVKED